MRPEIEVEHRIDLVEVDGRGLDRRRRAAAGIADKIVAVLRGDARRIPAFRQVDAPDIVLIALGFLDLLVQDVAAELGVGLAVVAGVHAPASSWFCWVPGMPELKMNLLIWLISDRSVKLPGTS